MEAAIAISLKNISKTFRIHTSDTNTIRERLTNIILRKNSNYKLVKALYDINVDIYKGESFGIIGNNGSGKSTLLNIIMETYNPDKGGILETNGKMMRLALGMGIDPNLTARDNIYVNGSIIGLSFKKIGIIFDQIIEFAGLQKFIDVQVKFYSKGMRQRLMFSIAMYADAEIFLLDEFFGGTGDQEFKVKSDKAFETRLINGKTNIIVSHSMQIIRKHCKRAIWLENGKIIKIGDAITVTDQYLKSQNKS